MENLRKTTQPSQKSQKQQEMIPTVDNDDFAMRHSLQSKDFVPRPRPKISLISPSPLSLKPNLSLEGFFDEDGFELEDDMTAEGSLNEQEVFIIQSPLKKSIFSDKINEWYKKCNSNETTILNILEYSVKK